MKELNMKPEEIANLVVLSREKGYAMIIPVDALYLVSKALKERDAQIAALTAENVALKDAVKTHSESVHFCELCGKDDPCATDDVCMVLDEAPATDAAANALRLEGVQMLLDSLPKYYTARSDIENFASQLREGK